MAIDLEKVKARLKKLETKNDQANFVWKPSPGTQVIRIVPYIHSEDDFPFIELYFDYEVTSRSTLSPITYGRPDPIAEFAEKLKATNNSDDYKMGKKIEPKERYFAQVIVRGEENEGVKFWGFGKTVYLELLKYIADPDYGDITDLENGRDITVEFKKPEDTGKSYPTTEIRMKPNTSAVGSGKQILDAIKNQRKIGEIYAEPTYDELADKLKKYLNPEDEEAETVDQTPATTKTPDTKINNAPVAPAEVAKSAEDLNAKFASLFDKK